MATSKTGGLAGVTAGKTELCTVGKEGAGLTYRGYDIHDLAANASFEEVAFLLLHGHLPTQAELDAYIEKIKANRGLPEELKVVLEMIPADAHPMDVLRTGVSFLGNIEPEGDFSHQLDTADRLLACLPSMLLYWHRFHTDGVRIDTETDDNSIAGHFLHMLHDKPPKELHRKCLDTTLILYAEHEFNASTFAGRVITGTLSDMHSAVTGAIGALRGPLHGGANESVLEMLGEIHRDGGGSEKFINLAKKKDSGFKLMGFGHRVYKNFDPRMKIIKKACFDVLNKLGVHSKMLEIAVELEEIALKDDYFVERKLYPNVDFYSGVIYNAIGTPKNMFTALFAIGRLPGWIAHWCEQNESPDFRIARPRQVYIGNTQQNYVRMTDRK